MPQPESAPELGSRSRLRSRATPSKATLPAANPSRKDRKRATDRQAQREHRKRQKSHVQQLEKKVQLLTSTSNTDGRIRVLLEEQARLREQCLTLAARLDRIRNIAGVERALGGANRSGCDEGDEGEFGTGGYFPSPGGSRNTFEDEENENDDEQQDTDTIAVGAEASSVPSSVPETADSAKPRTPQCPAPAAVGDGHLTGTNLFQIENSDWNEQFSVLLNCGYDNNDSHQVDFTSTAIDNNNTFLSNFADNINHTDDSQPIHDIFSSHPDCIMNIEVDHPRYTPSTFPNLSNFPWGLSKSSPTNNYPSSLMSSHSTTPAHNQFKNVYGKLQQQLTNPSAPAPITNTHHIPHNPQDSVGPHDPFAPHLLLPNTQPPMTDHESMYARMIANARVEHKEGRFNDTENPTLSLILSKHPPDTLCLELFRYMASWGPLPMHLFLAIYWVHYLYLRWQVLLTPAAYNKVPEFVRPRHVERLVPHRLSVNLLVWPDLRTVLILQSSEVNVDAVAIDLFTRVNPNWSPVQTISCFSPTSPTATASYLDAISSASSLLGNDPSDDNSPSGKDVLSVALDEGPSGGIRGNTGRIDAGDFTRVKTNALSIPIMNLDIIAEIERQACTFVFWKVDAAILDMYPCFRGCNLGW